MISPIYQLRNGSCDFNHSTSHIAWLLRGVALLLDEPVSFIYYFIYWLGCLPASAGVVSSTLMFESVISGEELLSSMFALGRSYFHWGSATGDGQ